MAAWETLRPKSQLQWHEEYRCDEYEENERVPWHFVFVTRLDEITLVQRHLLFHLLFDAIQ